MAQRLRLRCPACGNEEQVEVVDYINRERSPQLVEKLLANKLFNHRCSQCGKGHIIQSRLIYHDPLDQWFIIVLPGVKDQADSLRETLNDIADQSNTDLSNYHLRVVSNHAELVEKITLIQENLDDRLIEMVKLLTDGLFAQDFPGYQVKQRFFYLDKGKQKIFYMTDQGQYKVDLDDRLLDFSQDKLDQHAKEEALGEFHRINHQWALALLEGKGKS